MVSTQRRTVRRDHVPGTHHGDGPGDESAVRVRGLRKTYGSVTAVDGIDLGIGRGQVLALLGPNGAGKTTTVEILAGLRRRDSGQVRVLGVDPGRAERAWRSRIGMVLQSAVEGPELTVAELVGYYGAAYRNPRPTTEVLELVGLAAKARKRVHQLSGGQLRRMDVAIGIVGRPELLFLDEPTTGFDPEVRKQFWTLLGELTRDGMSMLLTTHNLDEAEALADHITVLVNGRVLASGEPAVLGGRDQALSRVRWTGPDGPHSVETAHPAVVVGELAAHFNGDVPDLMVSRPTLEDIYLELIGGDHGSN